MKNFSKKKKEKVAKWSSPSLGVEFEKIKEKSKEIEIART